jgi:hypothetical protein
MTSFSATESTNTNLGERTVEKLTWHEHKTFIAKTRKTQM